MGTRQHVEGSHAIHLDGGDVIRQAVQIGRVDEMTLSWVPVVLGSGTRLFEDGLPCDTWRLLGSRRFASGMVQARYRSVEQQPL